jgi:hypothetical protein
MEKLEKLVHENVNVCPPSLCGASVVRLVSMKGKCFRSKNQQQS